MASAVGAPGGREAGTLGPPASAGVVVGVAEGGWAGGMRGDARIWGVRPDETFTTLRHVRSQRELPSAS